MMALTWDETEGWVFTDAYHRWQDEQAPTLRYRDGDQGDVQELGWFIGLMSLASDHRAQPARWPVPPFGYDLDQVI